MPNGLNMFLSIFITTGGVSSSGYSKQTENEFKPVHLGTLLERKLIEG